MDSRKKALDQLRMPDPVMIAMRSITDLGRRIARASRMRRDRRALLQMSDRELSDMGISRYDIKAATPIWGGPASRRSRG